MPVIEYIRGDGQGARRYECDVCGTACLEGECRVTARGVLCPSCELRHPYLTLAEDYEHFQRVLMEGLQVPLFAATDLGSASRMMMEAAARQLAEINQEQLRRTADVYLDSAMWPRYLELSPPPGIRDPVAMPRPVDIEHERHLLLNYLSTPEGRAQVAQRMVPHYEPSGLPSETLADAIHTHPKSWPDWVVEGASVYRREENYKAYGITKVSRDSATFSEINPPDGQPTLHIICHSPTDLDKDWTPVLPSTSWERLLRD